MHVVKITLSNSKFLEEEKYKGTYEQCEIMLETFRNKENGRYVNDNTAIGYHLTLQDGTVYEIR